MNEHLRQSGRTSRMLSNAVALAVQGWIVYVLAHETKYAEQLRVRLKADLPSASPACKSIKFQTVPDDFDWAIMRPHSARHDDHCVWLVDHATIEQCILKLHQQIMQKQLLATQLYALTI